MILKLYTSSGLGAEDQGGRESQGELDVFLMQHFLTSAEVSALLLHSFGVIRKEHNTVVHPCHFSLILGCTSDLFFICMPQKAHDEMVRGLPIGSRLPGSPVHR